MARVKDRSIELEEDFMRVKPGKVEIPRAKRIFSSEGFDAQTDTYFVRITVEREDKENDITIDIESQWTFPIEIIPRKFRNIKGEVDKTHDAHSAMSYQEDYDHYTQWKRGQ